MQFDQPSFHRLTTTWVILVALTLMSMLGGGAVGGDDSTETLGFIRVAIILLVTFFKSYHVMMYFLNLQASTTMWKSIYFSGVAMIGIFIFLVYVVAAV